jgi:rod shape-determining protein MreC
MFDFLKRFRHFFIALLILFLALLILTLNASKERETSVVEKVLLEVSYPFQRSAQKSILWLKGLAARYIFLTRVQQENEDFKRLLSALREENNRLQEALLEEKRLEKLSSLQAQVSPPGWVAHVYARDPSNWFRTILIDKGEDEGLSKDMAVVNADGVVGRVIEVSANTAKVLQITDPNSALDVIIQRSRSQGIMEGKMGEICILKYVQKNEDVQMGDRVITSGLGGIFPKGLLVGTVTQVERKRPGIFQYIEVTPSADFSKLEEVLVLKEEP